MNNMQNNGFMATIVEQSGGDGGKAQLSNDAPTIIEKYQMPKPGAGRMDSAVEGEMEMPMSDLREGDWGPELFLSDKQLPSANGLKVGDKVCLKIEAEVKNYSFSENADGVKRQEYTFKLTEGRVDVDSENDD